MELALGTVLASRYRVLRELGRGGMGAVYLAEHLSTGSQVALKVLYGAAASDPDSIERFRREARAPAKIGSESVVKVLDADVANELGGLPFLAMELLVGDDLQKLVRAQGRLHPQEVVNMLTQVARALDRSHAIGIVHRDLKPENLFLHRREDGTSVVKLLDFGISKLVSASATSAGGMTRTGEVMGTPLYMSPEQAAGRVSLIGPASDVWSLGLIAVYLLTGEPYFQGNTIPDVLSKVLGYAMYAPSRRWGFLSPSFDAWLMRSCARDPAARFATAGEQIAALAPALLADAPTIQAFSDVGVAPTLPRSGPTPQSAPRASSVPADLAYGATMVGGSTNEPVIASNRSPQPAPLPWLAIGAAVLVLFVGASLGTVAFVTRRGDDRKAASAPDAAVAKEVPLVVFEVDAAVAPLASGPSTTTTSRGSGGKTPPKPSASASASAAPSVTATATPVTATNTAPSAAHQECVEECSHFQDINEALACGKGCPP